MKHLLIFAVIVTAINAQADDLSVLSSTAFGKFCYEGVNGGNGKWLINRPQLAFDGQKLFVTRRTNAKWTLESIDNNESTQVLTTFDEEIRDIKFASPYVWVATANKLTAVNAISGKVEKQITTAELPQDYPQHNQIGEFVIENNLAYVAQGMKGILVVDLQTGKVINGSTLGLDHQNGGHISKLVGLSISGQQLVAVADSVTMPSESSRAFNGVIRAGLSTLKVLSRTESDPNSPLTQVISTQIVGSTLLINNWGLVEKIDINSLQDGQKLKARMLPIKTVYEDVLYSSEALGDLMTNGQQVMGCAMIANDDNAHQVAHRTGVVLQANF